MDSKLDKFLKFASHSVCNVLLSRDNLHKSTLTKFYTLLFEKSKLCCIAETADHIVCKNANGYKLQQKKSFDLLISGNNNKNKLQC